MSITFFFQSAAFLSETLGTEVRLVGGAARDPLLGKRVGDCDFAAAAPREALREALERSGLVFKDTGAGHGGFTAELPCGEPAQITCTRRDVSCDGRRAETVFTPLWEEDALRRDFTVNALYMDGSGALYDYTGGLEDAARGVLRFIGEPARRCREDYLRVLRLFRFIAELPLTPERESLEACYAAAAGALSLSRERTGAEFRRLMAGPRAAEALAAMYGSPELLTYSCLTPGRTGAALEALREWRRLEAIYPGRGAVGGDGVLPAEALLLAAGRASKARTEAAETYAECHVMSKRKRKELAGWLCECEEEATDEAAAAAAVDRLGAVHAGVALRLRLALNPRAPEEERVLFALWEEVAARAKPFPLRGEDFLASGVPAARVGRALEAAKRLRREEAFRPDRDALLAAGVRAAEPA